jgi:hypothetical protein
MCDDEADVDTDWLAERPVPGPERFGAGSDDVSMGAQLGLGMLRWSSLGGSRFAVVVG